MPGAILNPNLTKNLGHLHLFDLPFDISWASKTPLKYPSDDCQAVVIGGKIWVLGEYPCKEIEIYDSATNSWSLRINPFYGMSGGTLTTTGDGTLYYIGHSRQSNYAKVAHYNPATDTLSAKADMLVGCWRAAVVPIGSKLYVCGGYIRANDKATNTVQVYDTTTNTWSQKSPLLTAAYASGATALGGQLYVIGGFSANRDELNTVQSYNPTTNTWSSRAPMYIPRRHLTAVSGNNGRIYAIGGLGSCASLNIVEEYNPSENKWTAKAPMPTARWDHASVAIGNKIYAIGGVTRQGDYQDGNPNVYDLAAFEEGTLPVIMRHT